MLFLFTRLDSLSFFLKKNFLCCLQVCCCNQDSMVPMRCMILRYWFIYTVLQLCNFEIRAYFDSTSFHDLRPLELYNDAVRRFQFVFHNHCK